MNNAERNPTPNPVSISRRYYRDAYLNGPLAVFALRILSYLREYLPLQKKTMIQIAIKEEDRQALQQGRYKWLHSRVMQKYNALWLNLNSCITVRCAKWRTSVTIPFSPFSGNIMKAGWSGCRK
jgi:hypothetical protein